MRIECDPGSFVRRVTNVRGLGHVVRFVHGMFSNPLCRLWRVPLMVPIAYITKSSACARFSRLRSFSLRLSLFPFQLSYTIYPIGDLRTFCAKFSARFGANIAAVASISEDSRIQQSLHSSLTIIWPRCVGHLFVRTNGIPLGRRSHLLLSDISFFRLCMILVRNFAEILNNDRYKIWKMRYCLTETRKLYSVHYNTFF